MRFPDQKLYGYAERRTSDDGSVFDVGWEPYSPSVLTRYPTAASWKKYLKRELSKSKTKGAKPMKKVIQTRVVKTVPQPVSKSVGGSYYRADAPSYTPSNPSKLRARVSEYNGHKVIAIRRTVDDTFPFTVGVAKAKLIVEHIDEIRAFVAQYGQKVTA